MAKHNQLTPLLFKGLTYPDC